MQSCLSNIDKLDFVDFEDVLWKYVWKYSNGPFKNRDVQKIWKFTPFNAVFFCHIKKVDHSQKSAPVCQTYVHFLARISILPSQFKQLATQHHVILSSSPSWANGRLNTYRPLLLSRNAVHWRRLLTLHNSFFSNKRALAKHNHKSFTKRSDFQFLNKPNVSRQGGSWVYKLLRHLDPTLEERRVGELPVQCMRTLLQDERDQQTSGKAQKLPSKHQPQGGPQLQQLPHTNNYPVEENLGGRDRVQCVWVVSETT